MNFLIPSAPAPPAPPPPGGGGSCDDVNSPHNFLLVKTKLTRRLWASQQGVETTTNHNGRIALVTGASSWIVAATVAKLAEAGAKVGTAARHTDKLDHLKKQINSQGWRRSCN